MPWSAFETSCTLLVFGLLIELARSIPHVLDARLELIPWLNVGKHHKALQKEK
jgi:hypothetical protein